MAFGLGSLSLCPDVGARVRKGSASLPEWDVGGTLQTLPLFASEIPFLESDPKETITCETNAWLCERRRGTPKGRQKLPKRVPAREGNTCSSPSVAHPPKSWAAFQDRSPRCTTQRASCRLFWSEPHSTPLWRAGYMCHQKPERGPGEGLTRTCFLAQVSRALESISCVPGPRFCF